MAYSVLEYAREKIFPIFSIEARDNGVLLDSRVFLGTAFFVTGRGDAVTAGHILPKPEDLAPSHRLVAIVQCGAEQTVCWITHYTKNEGNDFALVHVNLDHTKYLGVSEADVAAGEDVQIIGIPEHEVWSSGKEMRTFKGHVTLAGEFLELSISIPSGMSGSPVFVGTTVVGFASGVVSSESVEEYSEEVETLSNGKEQIKITQVNRAIHYGLAYPFSNLRGQTSLIFDGKTLMDLLANRNART